MHTTIMYITPEKATEYLAKNNINRTIRPNRVDYFKQMYERGEWLLTHQGIALAPDSTLLDGQHRLTFISQLPPESVVPMNVSFECDPATFVAIDRGAGRSAADVLSISMDLAAVATLFASLHLVDRCTAYSR